MVKNILKLIVFLSISFFCTSLFSQDIININTDSLFVEVRRAIDAKKFNEADELLEELNKINAQKNDDYLIKYDFYKSSNLIGKDNDELALQLLLNHFESSVLEENSTLYIKYAQTIGRILSRANDFDEAKNYFDLGLDKAIAQNDSIQMASLYLNIGSVFQLQQNIDSTAVYYEKVLEVYPKITSDKGTLATAYSNLIGVSLAYGKFDEAQEYGLKSLEIHKELKDTLKVAGVLSNLGSISMYLKEYDKSNEYYFEAIKLLEKNNQLKAQEIRTITLDNISQNFYLKGEYQMGYDYLFESVTVDKDLTARKIQSKISEIEAKFDIEKEERDTEIERIKRQRAESLIYLLLIVILVILTLLWLYHRSNNLKKEKILLENEKFILDQKRKVDQIKSENKIKILNATIDGKENERRYIADVLQENVTTQLDQIKEQIELLDDKKTESLKLLVQETSEKINNLSHSLVSPILLKFGLASSVEDLCEKYSNSKQVFNSDSKSIKRYEQRFEIRVHNIIEELIHNIIKRDNFSLANIVLKGYKSKIKINISDNGAGLDWDEVLTNDEIDLNQIRARVKMMRGTFEIETSNLVGTQITISLPIPE